MQKQNLISLFLFLIGLLNLTSCHNQRGNTTNFNEVKIAIDESFQPIIEEELKIFNAKFIDAEINAHFVTETEAINLLLKDSIRLAVTTRELKAKEIESIQALHKLSVRQQRIATDAIALIINKNKKDSLITLEEIESLMTGKIKRWEQLSKSSSKGDIQVVFDNANSSTVRYIQDSICKGKPFTGNLKAQHTNQEVIDFIKNNPNSIGVVGADWVKNPNDTSLISFDPSVKVMLVSRISGLGANYVRPYQYYIATATYPLTRGVYMILTDPYPNSMNRNFYYFMRDTEGQLIITKNSQLLPFMPVQVKQVNNNKM